MRSVGGISREGLWDELGWSEARKAKERQYLEAEALDPVTQAIMAGLDNGGDAAAGGA